MSNPDQSRRRFFKYTFMAAAGGFLIDALSGRTAMADEPKLIDLTGKTRSDAANKACIVSANAINYRNSAAEVAKDIKSGKIKTTVVSFKDKTGKEIPVEKRECQKCALFALTNPKLNTCALINGCLVNPTGACTSWSLKPGMM
jgi:hypothetical protein